MENIGVLEDLAAHELLASYGYQPYLIDGPDSRGIDVAYLVRGDLATVDGVGAYPEPTGLTSRPPLILTATIHLDSGDVPVYILNNHFSSLASGEAATEPRRTGQAAWNVTLMERIRQSDPEANFIVMGDFNSFYQTRPIDTLQEADLRHIYEYLPDDERPYTYIFQGATQTLDHILVSPSLFDEITEVTAVHLNADYPISASDDNSARRVSDHDPLIAFFTFP